MKQAVIMAAGRGTRLGVRAAGGPKCLVAVGGRPILQHQIEALLGADVSDIVIVTGFADDQVRAAAIRFGGECVRFAHNARFAETNVLASWMIGSEGLEGGHVFLHGDTVFEPALLDALRGAPADRVRMTVDRHACGDEEMKVRLDGDHVVEVSKTIDLAATDGEFTGVMWIGGAILGPLRDIGTELLGGPGGEKLFVEAALQRLIATNPEAVDWRDVGGLRWREVDFEEDWAAADAMFKRTVPAV